MRNKEAIECALHNAATHNCIYIVFIDDNGCGEWDVCHYDNLAGLELDGCKPRDVRYVLPHGEICKLS